MTAWFSPGHFFKLMSNGRVLIDTIRSELDSNAGLKLSAKTDGFLLLKAKDIQFPL